MNRVQLIDKLALCAPALSKTAFVPVLNKFWFTGKHILAFNEQIGMAVPCDTDFMGAVEGELLLALLRQSRAKEIEFKPLDDGNDSALNIKLAGTKIKLPVEPASSFLWERPEPDAAKRIDIGSKEKGSRDSDFLRLIDMMMLSVSGDTTIPDQLGITFVPEEGGVGMFSTNDHSMSYGFFKLKKKWPHRLILPSLFCTHLKTVCGGHSKFALEVHKDHVLAIIDDAEAKKPNPTILFSRVIESQRPADFAKNLDMNYTAKARKTLQPIPSQLKLALERAFIISQDKKESAVTTSLTVEEDRLYLDTSVDGRGEAHDSVLLEKHPAVKLNIEVKYLRNAYGSYHSALEAENGKLCVTPSCIIMTQGEAVYLLSQKTKQK